MQQSPPEGFWKLTVKSANLLQIKLIIITISLPNETLLNLIPPSLQLYTPPHTLTLTHSHHTKWNKHQILIPFFYSSLYHRDGERETGLPQSFEENYFSISFFLFKIWHWYYFPERTLETEWRLSSRPSFTFRVPRSMTGRCCHLMFFTKPFYYGPGRPARLSSLLVNL